MDRFIIKTKKFPQKTNIEDGSAKSKSIVTNQSSNVSFKSKNDYEVNENKLKVDNGIDCEPGNKKIKLESASIIKTQSSEPTDIINAKLEPSAESSSCSTSTFKGSSDKGLASVQGTNTKHFDISLKYENGPGRSYFGDKKCHFLC